MISSNTFSEELATIGRMPGILAPQDFKRERAPFPWNPLHAYSNEIFITSDDEAHQASVSGPTVESALDFPTLPYTDCVFTPLDLNSLGRLHNSFGDHLAVEAVLGRFPHVLLNEIMRRRAGSGGSKKILSHVTSVSGTEAFGAYLPWHMYAKSTATPWGMYFFLEPLLDWAVVLSASAKLEGISLAPPHARTLAFALAYRHELFHFHVERFSIRHEVAHRKPFYLPYVTGVFDKTANSKDWLEEALAQSVVLNSSLVKNKIPAFGAALRPVVAAEFKTFGDGYRDFDCSSFGGPTEAHKLLAAQVVTAQTKPTYKLTTLASHKSEFSARHLDVPAYLVFKHSFISRFQLSMPKEREWRRFARTEGFTLVGPGPGDHEKWEKNGAKVQINYKRGECDMASMKAVNKLLDKSLHDLVIAIRQA